MTERFTARPDKHTLGLLKVSVWSSVACIVLLFAINLLNLLRRNGVLSGDALEGMQWGNGLSPEIVLVLSAGLCVYLILTAVRAQQTEKRLSHVYLSVEEDTVTGISLGNPMESDDAYPNGRPFSHSIAELTCISVEEIHITQQQTAPCLVLQTKDDICRVPAIEEMETARILLTQANEGDEANGN